VKRVTLSPWAYDCRLHSPEKPGDICVEEAERRSGVIIQYRRVNILLVIIREVLSIVCQPVAVGVLPPWMATHKQLLEGLVIHTAVILLYCTCVRTLMLVGSRDMLRRMDAGFSQRLLGLTHRSLHVGFEVDKVTLGPGHYQLSNNHNQRYRNKGKPNIAWSTTKAKAYNSQQSSIWYNKSTVLYLITPILQAINGIFTHHSTFTKISGTHQSLYVLTYSTYTYTTSTDICNSDIY
jgi:hypothetical protein